MDEATFFFVKFFQSLGEKIQRKSGFENFPPQPKRTDEANAGMRRNERGNKKMHPKDPFASEVLVEPGTQAKFKRDQKPALEAYSTQLRTRMKEISACRASSMDRLSGFASSQITSWDSPRRPDACSFNRAYRREAAVLKSQKIPNALRATAIRMRSETQKRIGGCPWFSKPACGSPAIDGDVVKV